MQNQSLLLRLYPLLWAVGFIAPFAFLSWKWAFLIIVFVTIITPLASLVLYAPFKQYALSKGTKTIGFLTGITEGVVALILISYLAIDTVTLDMWVFLGLLVFAYSTNQLARIARAGGEEREEEIWGMYGYTATLPVIVFFTAYPMVFIVWTLFA